MPLIFDPPLIGPFVRLLPTPRWVLVPGVVVVGDAAVYSVNGSAFDLMVMPGLGVLGSLVRRLNVPVAPVLLALVLAPSMETDLRRALSLARADWQLRLGSLVTWVLWGWWRCRCCCRSRPGARRSPR